MNKTFLSFFLLIALIFSACAQRDLSAGAAENPTEPDTPSAATEAPTPEEIPTATPNASPTTEPAPEAALVPRAEVGEVLVLSYHAFTEDASVIEKWDLYMSPGAFKSQLQKLLECGYTPIFASELASDYLPEKPVVITIDDGYLDNYEIAFPILKECDVKATIFIIASYLEERPEYLTWAHITEMYESGLVDFQSHTYNLHATGLVYPEASDISYDAWLALLDEDAQLMEDTFLEKLGYAPTVLCYPLGKWNMDISDFYSSRYNVFFSGNYGVANLSQDSLLALPRIWSVESTVIKP